MNIKHDTVVDEFLVMRCQQGDPAGLTALYTKWQRAFLRYATIVTRDPELAADVLQDAWIKIIRALPGLRDPLHFSAWAYRIIHNQCMDALRRASRTIETEAPPPVTPIRDLENREQVWTILAQLSADHRAVLALHYLQGFEISEIAGVLRRPEGTIKSRLHHAREKFRLLAEDDQPEQENTAHGNDNGQTRRGDRGSTAIRYRPA